MIGTTSSKLSYLLSRIHELYREEKILVFYDGENSAYYIAQSLELLHINHLIYAKTLSATQKSAYIVQFEKESTCRVLLMDVNQAAHGLNVSSASRVFFINFCRPQIAAQAIKRAHRIGQSRRVVVETLLLEDTVEEQLFERSRRMTRAENTDAKVLDDDGGIKEIIQQSRLLPISDEERTGYGQIALLGEMQQLWSRPGWAIWKKAQQEALAAQLEGASKRKAEQEDEDDAPRKARKKASGVQFADVTDPLREVSDWPAAEKSDADGPGGSADDASEPSTRRVSIFGGISR